MLALALAKHFGISLVPQATGNYSVTLTQVMTKQVDIGFAQAPFVLDAVEDGRIRLVAKGADMPEVQNQSIRAWIVHANTLERRRDALARYVTAYRETLDWLYSSPTRSTLTPPGPASPNALPGRRPISSPKTASIPFASSGLRT